MAGAVRDSGRQPRPAGLPSKNLSEDAIHQAWKKMVKAAALDPSITVYSLRHTYATMALRSGVDIRTVQMRMGHSKLDTTMAYLHYVDPEAHPMDRLPY